MNEAETRLWERIAAFPLDDPGSELTFTSRLARENGWGLPYTRRVVAEYRRFLFLAMAAGHPVTPSDPVDQAWHLHLAYTLSYWDDLCRDLLGRPLHHGPSRGGAQEAAKFLDWYGRTLDSYRRLFGADPPADVWPPAAGNLGREPHFVRVNATTHWIVPRPATILRARVMRSLRAAGTAWWSPTLRVGSPAPRGRRLALPALAMLAALSMAIAGCRAARAPDRPPWAIDLASMSGPEFLSLFVPLTLGAVVGSVLLRWWIAARQGQAAGPEPDELIEGSGAPKKLDPYALILLAHGPARTAPVQAALSRLVGDGRLRFDESEKRLSVGPSGADWWMHPVEQAVLDAVRERSPSTTWELVQTVARSESVREVEDRLRALGWVESSGRAMAMRLDAIVPLGVVFLLGLWRIGLGLERGRPVGFLVLLCIALIVAAAIHLAVKPWRTPRGKAVLAEIGRQKDLHAGDPPDPSDPRFPVAFALLGLPALPGTGVLAALRQDPRPG
jgi:uncharacterized protein (TIGR04222 family)